MTNTHNALLFALCLIATATAHTNLRWPEPYNEDRYQPGNAFECKGSVRCGPCPLLPAKLDELPITTWHRDQVYEIQWHRNNHRDGFYRRSLVPFQHIMNKKAHEELAFDWGCHSQNTFLCMGKEDEWKKGMGRRSDWEATNKSKDKWRARCGADNHKPPRLHRSNQRVPLWPDGLYVFSQMWYGGSDRTGDPDRGSHAKFSNFAMCALIRIKGGPITKDATMAKTFQHGIRDDFDPRGKEGTLGPKQCWSTSDIVDECGGEECKGVKLQAMTPRVFVNNQGKLIQPPPIKQETVKKYIHSKPNYDIRSVHKEDVFPGWKNKEEEEDKGFSYNLKYGHVATSNTLKTRKHVPSTPKPTYNSNEIQDGDYDVDIEPRHSNYGKSSKLPTQDTPTPVVVSADAKLPKGAKKWVCNWVNM